METMLVRFKVEGTWPFPVDMLRYDCCFPASQADVVRIEEMMVAPDYGKVTIELEAVHHSRWAPTSARWESFGWRVIE